MRRKYGYPKLDEDAKRHVLGLNSARLYGHAPGTVSEHHHDHKERYVAMGPEPSNTRYGWIRTKD
jgi:hypothetical protein